VLSNDLLLLGFLLDCEDTGEQNKKLQCISISRCLPELELPVIYFSITIYMLVMT